MRRASAVVCAAIIGSGGLVVNQALGQMVRHVDGQGPATFLPPEPTVQGTIAALSSEPDAAAQPPTAEDQAKHALGRRIQEARQRQCNAEWEQFHQAKAELCKQPASGIREVQCSLDILGYEPSALCR